MAFFTKKKIAVAVGAIVIGGAALAFYSKSQTPVVEPPRFRSPIDGVIIKRIVDLGQTVAASFTTPTLFQIAQDLTKMQIDTSVSEADVGALKKGDKVVTRAIVENKDGVR